MEHRWGSRIVTDIPIRLVREPSGVVSIGRLIDVSFSGGLIIGAVGFRVFSHIQIVLRPSQFSKSEAPVVFAYVTRQWEHELGIEWLEFAPAAIAKIVRMTTDQRHTSVPQLMRARL
jgi:hypothetical protein